MLKMAVEIVRVFHYWSFFILGHGIAELKITGLRLCCGSHPDSLAITTA